MYQVLLYYNYTPIEDPEKYRAEHHLFCIENNILGRVIVSKEGLNGTVSGLAEDCQKYMDYLLTDERFAKTQFKVDQHQGHAFHKLYVRVKSEIVHSGLNVNPNVRTGKYVEPSELQKMLEDPNVVLVDMRSTYEHSVGKFKNAVTMEMESLRELPEHMDDLEKFRDKKVVTYCTGGIKCEKASAYLLEKGFKDVYQLHGGIIRYGLEEGGKDFDGKCYVFDNRVAVDLNRVNPSVISNCYVCGNPSDRMVNCANAECNKHTTMCIACSEKLEGACSEECRTHPEKRPYDGRGYYPRQGNHYTPLQGFRSTKKQKKSKGIIIGD